MHIPESTHLWLLFLAGHTLHVLKRAGLSVQSNISGTQSRLQWLRTNAVNLAIRLFVNAAAFSYWLAHPDAPTQLTRALNVPFDSTIAPCNAAAAMFGLCGDTLVDWAAAKIPFLQKEIPVTGSASAPCASG